MNEFTRFAQIVRKPAAVVLQGHHPTLVPAMGSDLPPDAARPGVRLLVRDLDPARGLAAIDITSTAAIAMLEGFLHSGAHVGKLLTWRARGFGKMRRDTLRLTPVKL